MSWLSTLRSGRAGAVLLLVLSATPLGAQCDPTLVEEGIQAFQDLRLSQATTLLERAARMEPGDSASCWRRERTLTYLGAAQLFQGMEDEAADSFRSSVLLNPRFEPDTVVFPPAVTELYGRVRRETPAVALDVPEAAELRPGTDSLRLRLFATSAHPIVVSLEQEGSAASLTLYRGPGGDSLHLSWDGLGPDGAPARPGRYVLEAAPAGGEADEPGASRVSLLATYPDGPPDLRGERRGPWRAVVPLGQALLASSAAVALHELVDPGGGGAEYRFVVAGAIGAAGFVGVAHRLLKNDDAPAPRLVIRRSSPAVQATGTLPMPAGR